MKSQTITTSEGSYTITYPTTNVTLGAPVDTTIIAKATSVGNTTAFLVDSNNNAVFNPVTEVGFYYQTVEIIGRQENTIVFYANPTFEFIWTGSAVEVLQGFPAQITTQGNASHAYTFVNDSAGFKIEVHGPDADSTNFTAVIDKPIFSRVYLPQLQYNLVATGNIDNTTTKLFDITDAGLVDQNKTVILSNGTWNVTTIVESVSEEYPFYTEINQSYSVSGGVHTRTSAGTPNSQISVNVGNHPISNLTGVQVTITGAQTSANYVGSIYATKTS